MPHTSARFRISLLVVTAATLPVCGHSAMAVEPTVSENRPQQFSGLITQRVLLKDSVMLFGRVSNEQPTLKYNLLQMVPRLDFVDSGSTLFTQQRKEFSVTVSSASQNSESKFSWLNPAKVKTNCDWINPTIRELSTNTKPEEEKACNIDNSAESKWLNPKVENSARPQWLNPVAADAPRKNWLEETPSEFQKTGLLQAQKEKTTLASVDLTVSIHSTLPAGMSRRAGEKGRPAWLEPERFDLSKSRLEPERLDLSKSRLEPERLELSKPAWLEPQNAAYGKPPWFNPSIAFYESAQSNSVSGKIDWTKSPEKRTEEAAWFNQPAIQAEPSWLNPKETRNVNLAWLEPAEQKPLRAPTWFEPRRKIESDVSWFDPKNIVYARPSWWNPPEEPKYDESEVAWDAWYEKFAKTAEPILLEELEKSGYPAGKISISITVQSNLELAAHCVNQNVDQFSESVEIAYNKMTGNSNLRFPSGSMRKKIVFLVDLNHDQPGKPGAVTNKTVKGDKEQVMISTGK